MKRVLLLVAALFMVAGVAHAQLCDMSRSEIVDAAVDVFNDWDGAGELEGWITENPFSADVAVWDEIAVDGFELSVIDPDLADQADSACDWFFMLSSDGDASDDFHTGVWDTPTTTATAEGLWGMRLSEEAEWYLALVGCEGVGPAISARITGPHNVDVGDSVVLEVVTEGFDEGTETYLWDDDSTAATRDLGVVGGGDTGLYTCEVSGDVDEEPLEEPLEASFTLWVGVATPLAGGLGLGLLAGACALAGVIAIRHKK